MLLATSWSSVDPADPLPGQIDEPPTFSNCEQKAWVCLDLWSPGMPIRSDVFEHVGLVAAHEAAASHLDATDGAAVQHGLDAPAITDAWRGKLDFSADLLRSCTSIFGPSRERWGAHCVSAASPLALPGKGGTSAPVAALGSTAREIERAGESALAQTLSSLAAGATRADEGPAAVGGAGVRDGPATSRSTSLLRADPDPPKLPVLGILVSSVAAVVAVALYSRLRADGVASQRVRGQVLALLVGRQLTAAEVARELEVHYTTAQYHLRLLARAHLVRPRTRRARVYYAAAGEATSTEILSPSARRVFDAVSREPGASVARIAEVLGLSPFTVHYQVRRLEIEGALAIRRDARRLALYPAAGNPRHASRAEVPT
ncbi:MAG TPA: helix-turn-helix domain-containing protein [Candidatus Thermoplasmatota archaeon]|nr:helix-turn-helix domain-containing protein [Candidatus Thermoplasmatota archaeon]